MFLQNCAHRIRPAKKRLPCFCKTGIIKLTYRHHTRACAGKDFMITPTKFCAAALAACALTFASLPDYLLPASIAQAEAAAGNFLQTSKQANMRKEPDKRSDIREKLKKGTKVEILDRVGMGENA